MKKKATAIIAVIWVLFQLVIIFWPALLHITSQRAMHLLFALILAWVLEIGKDTQRHHFRYVLSGIFIMLSIIVTIYVMANSLRFELKAFGYTLWDNIIAIIGIIVILETTRRIMGWALVIVVGLFFGYGLFGHLIPGLFGHPGFSFISLTQKLMYTIDGVYGQILGISTSLIFVYLLFGGFLLAFGGGEFFTNLAYALVGKTRGGAAKVAVVASAFFGSISGSSISNVVTTGTITIPMMKKVGFKREFAGAVEAVASTGGQFLPPVMGASAFIMADMMGVSYGDVVIAAFVPAVLYFMAILFMVDFEAAKTGLRGLDKEQVPSIKKVLKEGGHFLIPFAVLIYLLIFLRWEAQLAGIYAIATIVILQILKKPRLTTLADTIESMKEGARNAVVVAIPCATIGMIVGLVLSTGLGFSFTSFVRSFTGEDIFIMLVVMMIGSIVMGMGVPTSAAYIMLAVMMIPGLIELGVSPMAANMFALYFACLSLVTPPVALTAYTAAGIAKSKPLKTGIIAFSLALSGFVIPFVFVYQPGLMLIGSPLDIINAITSTTIAILCLSGALVNYFFGRINIFFRFLLGGTSVILIFPNNLLIGIFPFVAIVAVQFIKARRSGLLKQTEINR